MEINVFSPRNSVKSALLQPDLKSVAVLVLVSAILSIIFTILSGMAVSPLQVFLSIARSFLVLLVLSVVLYGLFHIVKGEHNAKGKFQGIVSAVSMVYIAVIVLTIVSFILTPMVFSKNFSSIMKQAQQGTISAETAKEQFNLIMSKDPNAINPAMGFVFVILGAIITVWGLYWLYVLVSELFEMKGLRNLAMFLFWLIIAGILTPVLLVF